MAALCGGSPSAVENRRMNQRVQPGIDGLLDVAIDVSAIKANSGGVRRYAHELVAELGEQNIRPMLLARSNDVIADWPGADRFLASAPADRVRRLIWEQTLLLRTLHVAAPDVTILHSPHYTMPYVFLRGRRTRLFGAHAMESQPGMPAMMKRRMKRVVTIHDLSYFTRPEDHTHDKRALFTRAIAYAAKSADALICVSDRTAAALREHVRVNAPVFVAPHGIDHRRFRPYTNESTNESTNETTNESTDPSISESTDQTTSESTNESTNVSTNVSTNRPANTIASGTPIDMRAEDLAIRKAIGIEGDYILSLSAIEPRKNLAMLIRAYDELLANDPSLRELSLVIGGEGWPGVVESLPTSKFGRLVMTGFVPEAGVAPLFRGALCVAYPSFEEGFGLPALEALACGAPVVTTAGSVMHDLLGNAAIAVEVTRADTLAAGLATAVSGNGPSLVTRLAKARTFTWGNSAASHAAAYRSCR